MTVDQAQARASQLLRAEMPVSNTYAYFDHAAVAPLPRPAAAAICKYAQEAESQGDVGWMNWAAAISGLREHAAELISANTNEIALVGNTTQGINLVAEGLPWEPGDNVVLPSNEFPSNLLPWRNLQRRGVHVREVQPAAGGEVLLDDLEQAIDSRTRLLAISWVGFSSGYRVDVRQVVELAHSLGCLVFLDAIQGLGAFPLSVRNTGVDFLCADGHKWLLGPEGAGLLFVKEEHLEMLTPLGIGWNSLASAAFDPQSCELKKSAARYEGGTLCIASMLGFSASLQLLLRMGTHLDDSPVAAAILANVEELDRQLAQAGFQTSLAGDASRRSGIVGITWPGANENELVAARKYLLNRSIVTSVRGGRLRAAHTLTTMKKTTGDSSRLCGSFGTSQIIHPREISIHANSTPSRSLHRLV